MANNGHDDVVIENGNLANNSMADSDDVHRNLLDKLKNSDLSLPSVKAAQENARYVLSVFTKSTTMGYSTSLRQWNYIYDWCITYMNQYKKIGNDLVYKTYVCKATYFEEQLYYDFLTLSKFIRENLYIEELRDTKDRCFDFLAGYADIKHPMAQYNFEAFEPKNKTDKFYCTDNVHSVDDNLGVVYNISYLASFVQIAQAERHRTLKYYMLANFNKDCIVNYFVPPMIRNTSLEKEWLDDLESIEDVIPQARMIGVVETGHISDFILKCKERLCGRAQWEIMHQTKLTAQRFIKHDSDNAVYKAYIDELTDVDGKLKTKAQLCNMCKEGCMWTCKEGLSRPF
jgi:hypothetical protein